ncbi:cytochrome c biogenesis protein ResB [Verrucomicrobiales bacterium]|nr:cytochrome c biogenesis protein ResB [Verrucomicrobiales bacterium]MDC0291921.1 cytochrome c biogenesis protein ResB [Verrucomicrobiales bacterium]MDC0322013.1 cytochrome c biogenesis protein ResB [Verrucomicrobiales bacterium]
MAILKGIYKFFSSFLFAAIILILLTIVTLFGTLAQKEMGLHGGVKEFFHSYGYSVFDASPFGIPIKFPLPGGMTLMFLLFISMTLGGVVHVKKRVRGIPNLIIHCGMLFLLVSGYITHNMKRDGYVALYPGTSTNRAQSYKDWQIEVFELGENDEAKQATVIPWENLRPIGDEGSQVFTSKAWPFSVQVENFYRNARPIPTSAPISAEATGPEINGFKLLRRETDKEVAANFPGCFAKIIPADGSDAAAELILSGTSDRISPDDAAMLAGFEFEGKKWGIQLVKRSWEIAFNIELEKFIFEKHPGTTKAKNFESRIIWREDLEDEGKKVAVRMNDPMRQSGFVVFQESYGPPNPGPGEQMYSQFAVSDDPADYFPLIALIIITIGLVAHFVWRLAEYISKSSAKRRAA